MTPGESAVLAIQALHDALRRPLTIVETGTIRGDSQKYANNDGYSTLHIARWIKDHGGRFVSIDLATEISARVLEQNGLREHVDLRQGDSAAVLSGMPSEDSIHFAYLDSCDDPAQNLAEFKEVAKRGACVVMIDDVYCWEAVNKGRLTIPIAQQQGYLLESIGNRLAILVRKEYANRILPRLKTVTINSLV